MYTGIKQLNKWWQMATAKFLTEWEVRDMQMAEARMIHVIMY